MQMSLTKRKSFARCTAFTLVELLVVIAVIGILVALLLPAIQAAREAARRAQCLNNVKQVCLAVQSYESARKSYPTGGTRTKASGSAYGHSWWISILPFMEENALAEDFDDVGTYSAQGFTGWTGGPVANEHNRELLDKSFIKYMQCPSSDVPKLFWNLAAASYRAPTSQMPHYTGVAGAVDHPTTTVLQSFGGVVDGRICEGGVLLPYNSVTVRKVTDGTSSTMLLCEQSDWCIDAMGQQIPCASDCQHGFSMGATNDGTKRVFNVTILRHPLGMKSFTALGVAGNCGPNKPVQSAHPGGAHVGMCDGSAHYLTVGVELQLLFNLANRNDGNVASINN
jgi:prepilin-type N-terminal cleavage/methylation domain-containing protein